jgi:autotransporter-associated beta strand protein
MSVCISTSTLTATDIPVNTLNDSGAGSLRQGLSVAVAGDTLDFQANLNTNPPSTLFNGQALVFSNAVTLSDVNAGGITLGDNHALTLATPLTVDWLGTLTLNGLIADGTTKGSLVKDGTGTLVLSSANTFTGGTTLGGGAIEVANSTALGTGVITVNNTVVTPVLILDNGINLANSITLNSALSVNAATGSSQLSGVISESGSSFGLNVIGSGTLTLSGKNTFSGGVNVTNTSTLNVTNSSALGTGTLTNSGALTLNLSNGLTVANAVVLGNNLTANVTTGTATLSGNISGGNSSQLNVSGAGSLILTGVNSYTGGTAVNGGILEGNSSSLVGNISNNGSLIFNQTANGTFAGDITGTGTLTKLGTGTLIFSGNGSSTTTTTVSAGELQVTGALDGTVSVVNTASLLSGTGTVGSVTNSGSVQPGTASNIGTLNVSGNYTQQSSGTTEIKVNSSGNTPGVNNDLLSITGTATLDGSMKVNVLSGGTFTTGTQYTFLNATGGVSGQFAQVSSNNALYGVDATYGANNVTFQLWQTSNLTNAATSANQLAVGTTLANLANSSTGGLNSLINTLGLESAAQIRSSLDQLSGEVFGGLQTLGLQVGDQFQQRVTSRLVSNGLFLAGQSVDQSGAEIVRGQSPNDSLAGYGSPRGWIQGYGAGGSLRGDGNGAGLNFNQGGGLYGLDVGEDESGRLGFVLGNSYVGFRDGFGANGQLQSYQFGVYTLEDYETFYWLGTANYGYNINDTNRNVSVGGANQALHANFSGSQIGTNIETGLKLDAGIFHLQPLIGLQYLYLCQQGFNESGGSAALDVDRSRANSLRANIGARLAIDSLIGPSGAVWTPFAHARFVSDLLDNDRYVNATFNGAPIGGAFISQGTRIGQNYGIIGDGLQVRLSDTWSLFGGADYMVGDRISVVTGSAGATYLW